MDSDFPEGVKRIHNKTTAILRWFMFNPYCCLQTVWGVIVVKGEGGKELYLAVILPNVLNISYYWHFKAGSLSRGTNAALLSCPAQNDCTGNHSWEILEKPSKHLWLERISLKKKSFSCSEKCVQTIRSPQNVSHPSRCHQHCQESNSSLEYLSISFWWCFGGPLPSSVLEQVLCLVINVPENLSQLQDGLL